MKFPLIIYFVLFSCSIKLSAQDNLFIEQIKAGKSDTSKINTYIAWGENVFGKNSRKADSIWNLGAVYAQKCADRATDEVKILLSVLQHNISIYYFEKGDFQQSLDKINESIHLKEITKDTIFLPGSLNVKASIYQKLGDLKSALPIFEKALNGFIKNKDTINISIAYNNIASLYQTQKQFASALDYFSKSLKLSERISDSAGLARTYNNLASVYSDKGDIKMALVNYLKSFKINTLIDDKRGLALNYNNLGTIYAKLGKTKEQYEYYYKSVKLYEELNIKTGLIKSYSNLGAYYLQENQLKKARELFEKAYKLANETKSPQYIAPIALNMSILSEKQGNLKEALMYYKQFKTMTDSVFNESSKSLTIKQQLQYEFKQKENQMNAEKVIRDKMLKSERKNKTTIIWIGSIFLLILSILSVLLYTRYRERSRQKKLVEYQKKQLQNLHQNLIDSINYSKIIQNSLLPTDEEISEHIAETFVFYKPKDIVSGDFYFIGSPTLNEGINVKVVGVGDCTGHGVPGAFLTILGKTFLQLGLTEKTVNSCADALNFLNNGMIEVLNKKQTKYTTIQDGMDISLIAINYSEGTLQYSGANNSAYIIRNGELILLKAQKASIAEFDKNGQLPIFVNQKMNLLKGDMIYLITDGIADQFGGPNGKKFKYKALEKLFIEIAQLPTPKQKIKVEESFEEWKGELDQVDDICVFGIKYT